MKITKLNSNEYSTTKVTTDKTDTADTLDKLDATGKTAKTHTTGKTDAPDTSDTTETSGTILITSTKNALFYREMLDYFKELRSCYPDVYNSAFILWNNKEITTESKSIFWKYLFGKEIRFL